MTAKTRIKQLTDELRAIEEKPFRSYTDMVKKETLEEKIKFYNAEAEKQIMASRSERIVFALTLIIGLAMGMVFGFYMLNLLKIAL